MAQLIPAILAQSEEEFREKQEYLLQFFDTIQIDVMDGSFVDNTSFCNPKLIADSQGAYELHLMISNPLNYIHPYLELTNCTRLIVHIETLNDDEMRAIIDIARKYGKEIGVAINPSTRISQLHKWIPELDLVLIMGVEPGWSGQEFSNEILDRIRVFKEEFPNMLIEVDGGVSIDNYQKILAAGADILASASMIFSLSSESQLTTLISDITNFAR